MAIAGLHHERAGRGEASMAERKSPYEKKALSYSHDHVTRADKGTKPLQRTAPNKEQASRKFRRHIHQVLDVEQDTLAVDPLEDTSVDAIRREHVQKAPATPLGQWIDERQSRRVERTAANYFKHSYTSAEHREKFAAFLDSTVRGHSENSRKLAEYFATVLDPESRDTARIRDWLRAFFHDEPQWEQQLREWIASMTA
jgi:hypothetical protein